MIYSPTTAWVLTILECLFGFWLAQVGWPVAGGIIIGAALALQWTRIKP